MTSLSGGNQQKVLVARALRLAPRVLVLDDPTAGVDVGAREQVHRIIEQHTTDSMSVLLVSTDSDELARLCDRVLVMVRGVVATELHRGPTSLPRTSTTRKSLGRPPEPDDAQNQLGGRPMTTTMSESVVALTPDTPPRGRLSVTLGRFSAPFLWLGFVILFGFITGDTFFTKGDVAVDVQRGRRDRHARVVFLVPLVAGVYDLSVGAMMGLSLVILNWFGAEQPDVPIALVAVGRSWSARWSGWSRRSGW